MKITLAIPTYNRLHYIEKMISSLSESVNVNEINVRVYDDKSTEFGPETLHHLFSFAQEIIIRPYNLKADLNMRTMYVDFLNTGDDVFIHGDSDLIYRPGWLEFFLQHFDQTDGVLSLYNSKKHPFLSHEHLQNNISLKKDLGAAGTAFKREVVELIIKEMEDDALSNYDWKWSEFLTRKNIRLFCACNSYIQHIGIQGQNNNGCINDFDYGLNFIPESPANQKIMSEFIEELLIENQRFFDNHPEEVYKLIKKHAKTIIDYRIGHTCLFIPREIKKIAKRIFR